MKKKSPFFSNFIEAETLTPEEEKQISGGWFWSLTTTRKSPSDTDEGVTYSTRKSPSDNDEG